MSINNDIDWRKQETKKFVFRILEKLRRTRKDSLEDIDESSDQEQKKSGMGRTLTNQTVCGITLLR